MNNHERERLDRLIKRRDWLEQRIAERNANGLDSAFDNAERSALDWAIGVITAYYDEREAKKGPVVPRQRSKLTGQPGRVRG